MGENGKKQNDIDQILKMLLDASAEKVSELIVFIRSYLT